MSSGSHKSNLEAPALSSDQVAESGTAELVEAGIEVHLNAGYAVSHFAHALALSPHLVG